LGIGKNYEGLWISPSIFIIKILDPGNVNANSLINNLEIRVNSDGQLNSADGFLFSASTSLPLAGNFGFPSAPLILGFGGDGSSAPQGSGFQSQDVFHIKFSESTNEPGGTGELNNATLHSFLLFNPSLGNTTLAGRWVTPSLLNINVIIVDKSHVAVIGTTTVRPSSVANLKNAAGTSIVSNSTSTALSGSFGDFSVTVPVASGGSAVTTLPSGIIVQITLPGNMGGNGTFTKTDAPIIGNAGSMLEFLGSPTEISLPTGACQNLCTILFEFNIDDLNFVTPPALDPSQIRIFHDQNNDGDFKDLGEMLPTTITSVSPGLFIAIAQDSHTSRFALGEAIAPVPRPTQPPQHFGGGGHHGTIAGVAPLSGPLSGGDKPSGLTNIPPGQVAANQSLTGISLTGLNSTSQQQTSGSTEVSITIPEFNDIKLLVLLVAVTVFIMISRITGISRINLV
jgi:hypothetical protein